MKQFLTNEQSTILTETHRCTKEKHPAYRVNAILLLDKEKIKELLTSTERKRININGAIDVSNLDFAYREDATINSDSTIGLEILSQKGSL